MDSANQGQLASEVFQPHVADSLGPALRRWSNPFLLLPHSSRSQTSETLTSQHGMSSKRKWDQAAPEIDSDPPSKATKTEDAKTASEAAATAAAIAAKIAAQFANGGTGGGGKDPYDGDFTHDIDINDLRNRYLLTRGSTQQQVTRFCSFLSTLETHFCFFSLLFVLRFTKRPGRP